MSIHYTVSLLNPHAHIFKVTLEISQADKNGQFLSLPAWIPGSYMIRDFAKNIVQIKAHSNNTSVNISKLDKSTWQVDPVTESLFLEYEVYAWDLSVRSAHLDMTHAFFNGTSLFLMPHGFENETMTVEIKQPTDEPYSKWKLATSFLKKNINEAGFGIYQAKDYDDLIDHPVEIGAFSEFEFEVENTLHRMTLTGFHQADENRLKLDLTKICQTHCTMFGELPVENEYLFLVMVTGDGYGGLEHRSSTSLMCSRDDLPLISQTDDPDEKYRNFLGLCSHEYFHTWNVKRIKPEAYLPYDLSTESYTKQLWAFEGITSYYDELALVRCGVISVDSYLQLLGQTITRVLRGKGRLIQSVAESSFDTWTKFYKQDESAPNSIVSYYAKGALLALCLDLTIRKLCNDNKSLDDLMRYLWHNFGKKDIGVPEGEIDKIASNIAGTDLTDFFNQYLYGVKDLPLEELLNDMGIEMKLRATLSVDDKGGKAAEKDNDPHPASFGARFTENSFGATIAQVFRDGSAELAGLAAGDVIIAVNSLQVNKSNIETIVATYRAGSNLLVHAFRRDELMSFNLKLLPAELTTCFLQIKTECDESTVSRRETWLMTKR